VSIRVTISFSRPEEVFPPECDPKFLSDFSRWLAMSLLSFGLGMSRGVDAEGCRTAVKEGVLCFMVDSFEVKRRGPEAMKEGYLRDRLRQEIRLNLSLHVIPDSLAAVQTFFKENDPTEVLGITISVEASTQ